MPRTKQEIAEQERQICQQALEVQDACNLSGVVHSFSRVMTSLWEVAHAYGKGTDWVNTHPASVLFADKIQSLSTSGSTDIMAKWDECERIAKREVSDAQD